MDMKYVHSIKKADAYPWTRRNGETKKNYEVFCAYAGIGTGRPMRDLDRLGLIYGIARHALEMNAQKWDWTLRADAWEANLQAHRDVQLTEEARKLIATNLSRRMATVNEFEEIGNKLVSVFNMYAEWPQKDLVVETTTIDGKTIVRKPMEGAADLPKIARAIELIRRYEFEQREALEQGKQAQPARWPRQVAAAAIRAASLAQLEMDAETGDDEARKFIDAQVTRAYEAAGRPHPDANGHTNGHVNGSINGHVNGSANGHANGSTGGPVDDEGPDDTP